MTKSKTFTYVKFDSKRAGEAEQLRYIFEQAEAKILEYLKLSRYRNRAIDSLEMAFAWCGKALRDEQIEVDGAVIHVAERTKE